MKTHEVDSDIQDQLDKLTKKREVRASNTAAILVELDDHSSNLNVRHCPVRVVFCTKGCVPTVLKEIYRIEKDMHKALKGITMSYTAFTKGCETYGRFATSRSYRYYDGKKYPKLVEFIKEDGKVDTMLENK